MSENKIICSFCKTSYDSEQGLILTGVGDNTICVNCVVNANHLISKSFPELAEKATEHTDKKQLSIDPPKKIKAFLDKYVIGQNRAKKVLSVAVYNHYKRLNFKVSDVEIEKSNILLVGSTGSGKTLLAKTIARLLNVPFCIADATVLTEAGYVGEDVESIISRLLQAADYNTSQAEKGIIFIDEIDKIARKSGNPSITRDVSGEGVQQGLLKLLEGSIIKVPPQGGRKHPDQKLIEVDTKNILFICGGAFDQIEKLIGARLKLSTIGYNKGAHSIDESCLIDYITSEDIKQFGIIPELVGRMPVISSLKELGKVDLVNILTQPKNAIIKQYQKLFEMDHVTLSFSKDILEAIAEKAIESKLGARGLRMIVEFLLQDFMYELPNIKEKTIHLDHTYINKINTL